MTLRRAQPEDAASIAAVHVASWQAAYAGLVPQHHLDGLSVPEFTTRWQTWLSPESPDHTVLVAEAAGTVSGFVGGGPIRSPRPPFAAELYAIYLLPAAQRQGLGTQLFQELADALAARGYGNLLLWSLRHNPSIGFYEWLGGKVIAEDSSEIGGETLATVAFGWHDLAAARRLQ